MLRYLWFLSCSLLVATSVMAQSNATTADPVTGSWSGHFEMGDEGRRLSVGMELTFDGTSTVTGTVSGLPNPANVKHGRFDAKTGALTLRLGRVDGPAVLLVLEGRVDKGVATGTFTGDQSGTFRLQRR